MEEGGGGEASSPPRRMDYAPGHRCAGTRDASSSSSASSNNNNHPHPPWPWNNRAKKLGHNPAVVPRVPSLSEVIVLPPCFCPFPGDLATTSAEATRHSFLGVTGPLPHPPPLLPGRMNERMKMKRNMNKFGQISPFSTLACPLWDRWAGK